MSKKVTRLFQQFQPEAYDLSINLLQKDMRFHGTVTIVGKKVGRPSKRLTFHQKGLRITSATVTSKDKKGVHDIEISRINAHKSYDEIRLHADTMLYPGQYRVTMTFEAPITRGMTGLYPCFFTDNGQEEALLATQFESHHAREVFPCIDEPEAKATFDLSLTTDKDIQVIANTPIASTEEIGDGKMKTRFETTPRMSSYLLAFVTGKLQSKSGKTNRGTVVSAWATTAQPIDSLDFALDVSIKCIEFFEDYFGVPYPLAKADHVALPDFSSAAMENWGLITYRERVLLAYPGESSQSVREMIATVIAHETSHQWFGNLVTMRWWNDLWLNESFANMMEYQAVDALFPDWQVWDTFVASESLSALRRDATPGVQSVMTQVNHPDEISTLFDPSIVYAKGGRLLYMLKSFIGEDAFRKGLSNYFTKYAFKNTEGKNLWDELSKTSGTDVAAFMDPWLTRSGFPVVTIDQDESSVAVSQEHFSDNPEKADKTRLWPVPLFSNTGQLPALLDEASCRITLNSNELIRLNHGARGHYIVNYARGEQRARLAELVTQQKMSNSERLLLLNDASMLARAGYRSYGDVLALLSAYANESNETVWDMISLIIGECRRFIDYSPEIEEQIKSFIRKLIAKQYARLGWNESETDSTADQKLRATIIGLGSYAEVPEIVEKALEEFEKYKSNPQGLSTEIRSIVFGVPIKQGDDAAFAYLLNLHDTTKNSDLKSDISGALSATRSKKHAQALLDRLKDSHLVKPQDADRWLIYIMRNRYVRDTAWDWMVNEWAWIEETYSNDKSYDYMPRYAASVCNTREWAEKYKSFFEPKQDQVVLRRNIVMGIEEIGNRVTWLERDVESVKSFFKNH